MGPYCRFCDNRCFVHIPQGTPNHILKAYGKNTIIATCAQGQEFEKKKIGYCYDDIIAEIAKRVVDPVENWKNLREGVTNATT